MLGYTILGAITPKHTTATERRNPRGVIPPPLRHTHCKIAVYNNLDVIIAVPTNDMGNSLRD